MINLRFLINIYIICSFFILSCYDSGSNKAFKGVGTNNVTVPTLQYARDSVAILLNLYEKMKSHKESFTNKEYFDSTRLMIDTIMYDLSLNKVAVFVIAKNPIARNPYANTTAPVYYNASCYLGKRVGTTTDSFYLKYFGPYVYANFEDLNLLKKAIREDFFVNLSSKLDEHRQPYYPYNLGDNRFWDNAVWKNLQAH